MINNNAELRTTKSVILPYLSTTEYPPWSTDIHNLPINDFYHFSLRPLQFYTVGGGEPSQDRVKPSRKLVEIQPFMWEAAIFRLLPSLQENKGDTHFFWA